MKESIMSDTNNQTTPAADTKDTKVDPNCCTLPPGGDPGPGI